MKKKKLLISFSFVMIAILAITLTILKELKDMKNNLPDSFTYTAHTGCIKTKDNSLEAIEVGIANGADVVEFDLRFLEDGTPILAHDKPTGKEVTLDEAFKKVSEYDDILVNVDIKVTDNLQAVYPLAKKYGIEGRIFYTGVNAEFVEAVKKDSPQVPYYLNVDVQKPRKQTSEYLDELVKEVKESGAIGINFNKDNATKKLVDTFHENDLLVSIWTVNKKHTMLKILFMAPDNITTRRPDKMQDILE